MTRPGFKRVINDHYQHVSAQYSLILLSKVVCLMKIKNYANTALVILFIGLNVQCNSPKKGQLMTVNGLIDVELAGISLTHEHVLVDFIGADSTSEDRWVKREVVKIVAPYLREIMELGVTTFFECTPAYIGRDPLVLKALADSTGMQIVTNTGYYGAVDNKFIPDFIMDKSASEIAAIWIDEFEHGIGDSGIRPGFVKIGVNPGSLSELHARLIMAAAQTHLKTGLTIASHTGPALPAFEQLFVLAAAGVAAEAFVWVHAQNEMDLNEHVRAARMGAWISLDGLSVENTDQYVTMLTNMKDNELLHKVLLSHDAGWYSPGEENGGKFRGYTAIFVKLIPQLRENAFTDQDIDLLMKFNPQQAFEIKVRTKKVVD